MVTTPAPEEPTVENQTTEEVQVETEETTEETTEIDYKAKAAELEAQVDKLTNDLRSKDGQRRRDTDRDAEFAGFRDELGAMRKVFSLYMDALQKGDTYEVQDQISQVNQELDQSKAVRDYNSRYELEMSRLLSTVQDSEGRLFVSEEDAVKVQSDWAAAWEKAAKEGVYEDVYNVQIEAARMVAQEERRKAATERQQLADEAKNAGKKALEKAGVADLDTGAAIAGGNEELRGSALIERGLRKRNL